MAFRKAQGKGGPLTQDSPKSEDEPKDLGLGLEGSDPELQGGGRSWFGRMEPP